MSASGALHYSLDRTRPPREIYHELTQLKVTIYGLPDDPDQPEKSGPPTKYPGVARVDLNRKKKRNALNYQMFVEIARCFQALGRDPDVRAIVLTGNAHDDDDTGR
jgi:hypothetical protein